MGCVGNTKIALLIARAKMSAKIISEAAAWTVQSMSLTWLCHLMLSCVVLSTTCAAGQGGYAYPSGVHTCTLPVYICGCNSWMLTAVLEADAPRVAVALLLPRLAKPILLLQPRSVGCTLAMSRRLMAPLSSARPSVTCGSTAVPLRHWTGQLLRSWLAVLVTRTLCWCCMHPGAHSAR